MYYLVSVSMTVSVAVSVSVSVVLLVMFLLLVVAGAADCPHVLGGAGNDHHDSRTSHSQEGAGNQGEQCELWQKKNN